ncbi:RxLR effector protein, partial [Phytophthora megakarya]
MRLPFLVCLIFLVSVVFIDADTSATNPKVLQSNLSKTARYQGASNIGIAEHRLLRSNNKSDKGFTEERTGGLPVSVSEKLKTIVTPYQVTTEKLQQWIANGKSAVAVFQRLHFNKPESPLYKRHFAEWVKYADASSASNPKQSAISILTDKYGDYELFSIIKAAKRDELTKDIAFELETKQMQYWLANRKNPDEVFRLFELNMVW